MVFWTDWYVHDDSGYGAAKGWNVQPVIRSKGRPSQVKDASLSIMCHTHVIKMLKEKK